MHGAMPLIFGVGDEVVTFFVIVFVCLILYLAWRSTRIPDSTYRRTTVIVETVPNNEEQLYNNYPYWDELRQRQTAEYLIEGIENETTGPDAIIREMDRDMEDVATVTADRESPEQVELENCANENSENDSRTENSPETPSVPLVQEEDPMKIKLKYLNDDLKIVEGMPSQTVGDFKKKNFTVELSDNKLVRLVFNGHVLQPDSKTLRTCGLFDNCVVHCLVHVKERMEGNIGDNQNRTQSNTNSNPSSGITGPENPANSDSNQNTDQNNNAEGTIFGLLVGFYNRSPFIKHLLMLLFSVFVIYIRTQFAHLFTLTSTVGLLISTVLTLTIAYTLLM